MQIIRDGCVIKLTEDELAKAYIEARSDYEVNIDEYVYECKANGICLTTGDRIDETFAVCSNKNRARVFVKGYLLEQWQHKGYIFTKDQVIPGMAGHNYYIKKGNEHWLLKITIIRRMLNDAWWENDE